MELAFRSTKFAIYFCFLKYLGLLFGISSIIQAQVVENFEKGLAVQWEQSSMDHWDVSELNAISGQYSLKHIFDNPESGHDQIIYKHKLLMLDSLKATWSFRIRHGQNPSASNNWCVFLMADAPVNELTPELVNNAYCVGVNFSGSDDELKLWKVSEGNKATLIDTDLNWQDSVGTENAPYIEIQRSVQGLWEIFVNVDGDSTQLNKLGQAIDKHLNLTTSLGIYYAYTKTYDQALWFDDLAISGAFVSDNTAPRVEEGYFLTDTLVKISMNEPCGSASFNQSNIFTSIPGLIKNIEVVSHQECWLVLDSAINFSNSLTISLDGIEDLSGNAINDTTLELYYHHPTRHELIISEIMYDPSPTIGLPDVEYIELRNITDHAINLYQWDLLVGDKKWELPDKNVNPQEYVILCQDENIELFDDPANVLPLFTSIYNLPNDGDSIRLLNEKGEFINTFNYHQGLHADSEKRNGGWSLEIVDPLNQCNPQINWSSSIDPSGGTPGDVNSIDGFNQDTIRPFIRKYKLLDSMHIQLVFSKPIQTSAVNKTSFEMRPDIGQPINITWQNDTTLNISFGQTIQKGEKYELTASDITDLCNNISDTLKLFIQIYKAKPFDILITEIMADPTPGYGLPEVEYIELYNKSNTALNLDKWKLYVNDNFSTLPSYNLQPGEYVVLTNESAQNNFSEFVNLLTFNLPAIANNEGVVAVLDSFSAIIHATTYNHNWMESEYKQSGGWSLEMTDVDNPCGCKSNWQESKNQMGGTPGAVNSVLTANPDDEAPYATRIGFSNDSTIRVYFNEPLDSASILPHFFRVDNEITPDNIHFEFPMRRYLDVKFPMQFDSTQSYMLNLADGFADCVGNSNQSGHTFHFKYPQKPQKQDVVFNELLFNPMPGGSDYIEIINRSDKILDLKDLWLVSLNDENQYNDPPQPLSNSSYLFYPEQLLVVSADTSFLSAYYEDCQSPQIEMDQMPAMSNERSGLAIIDKQQVKIDSIFYDHSWHSYWIKNEDGVSLERLNPGWPGQQSDNWSSGIAANNYGSPGCVNANFTSEIEGEAEFTVEPKLFTPNADGYRDEAIFTYSLPAGNYVLHAWIYNSNGKFVARVKQDELVSHSGFFTWNGRNRNDLLCPIGIYLVYVEFVSETGHVEVFKETCVVGKKVE